MGQSFFLIFLLLVTACSTVPLTSQRRRIRRENENPLGNTTIPDNGCLLDNQTYARGQEVPSLGPCEKCVCEAPDVVCSMIKCQPNSGCRTIQQSGQCCPEYKCDCEYNGHVYNNGERLDKPEDPCQVCYCKGGEIMCTSITCYERDDCKPQYIAGQCCPKYDHCPIETNRGSGNSVRSVNSSAYSPKREMQPWPLTKSSNHHTSASYEETSGSPNVYPQTIRIVEILPTTPGYDSKPSEVSLVPRIKTTEQNENKVSDEPSKEAVSTSMSPSEYASSTSEVEHLLETTTGTEVVWSETTKTDNHKSTTLNPLAESVDPETLPDSYRFSTVFPNYYYTDGNLNNIEDQTTDIFDEPEGSGYVLLTGGMFEEIFTTGTYYTDAESSTAGSITDVKESVTNLPSDSSENNKEDGQPVVEISNSTIEVTTTEIPVTSEQYENNNTSLEKISQDNRIQEDSSAIQEDSSATQEDSSAIQEDSTAIQEDSTAIQEDSTSSFLNSSVNDSEESSNLSIEDSEEIKNSTSHLEPDSQYEQLSEELYNSSYTVKNSSEKLVVEGTWTATPGPLITEISTTPNLENENSTTEELEFTEMNTEPSDTILVSQDVGSNETFKEPTERKRATVGSYRNLDVTPSTKSGPFENKEHLFEIMNDSNQEVLSTINPSILFPPVLNLHTLGYSEISPFIENKTTDNLSSMAKVEIYHPIKPNESASYLTVVDGINNITHVNKDSQQSHILLTPNDLKKVAEMLIQEKIKPASDSSDVTINNETAVNPIDIKKNPDELVTENYMITIHDKDDNMKNHTNIDENVSGDNTSEVTEDNLPISRNNEFFLLNTSNSDEFVNTTTSYENIVSARNSDNVESSTMETESLRVATTPNEKPQSTFSDVTEDKKNFENLMNDDPNTSRKIRIPENANQYTAPLDDKDLLILENFFKKNMGLH